MIHSWDSPACCASGTGALALIASRRHYKSAVFPPPPSSPLEEPGRKRASAAGTRAGRAGADQARPAGPHQDDAGAGAAPAGVTMGTVIDASPHVLALARADGERRFAFSPGAVAWRGRRVEPSALRSGDRVVARLGPDSKNVVDKVWAGIGRVTGTIVESASGNLLVAQGHAGEPEAVTISPGAVSRIRVRFPQLEPGNLIDVIGLRRGAVLEALTPATSQHAIATSRGPRARAATATQEAGTISGSATWHEPAGSVADQEGVGYPWLDPSVGCAEAATATAPSCATLPYLAIGSMLLVRNECTGLSTTLPVTGCGRATRLFCDRCLTCGASPRNRVADLDLVSFVRLGGELERGCFNATIAIGW